MPLADLDELLRSGDRAVTWPDRWSVQVVTAHDELTRLVTAAITGCRSELLVMQDRVDRPGRAWAWYAAAAGRVLRVRTVYQHAARHHRQTGGLVGTFGSERWEFRSMARLPLQLVAVDRELCVLLPSGAGSDDAGGPGRAAGLVLHHPLAVTLLVGVVDEAWSRAVPFEPADPSTDVVGDEPTRSLLRLLASGVKDETVARRLGVSVRTCRRQIAEVMAGLGATSRFQAGVEAVRRSLL